MKILIQISISLLLLIAGTFLGYVVQKYLEDESRKIRYLDRDIDIDRNIISWPSVLGPKLKIHLEEKSIENLSRVSVTIHNFTDNDFSDVPVFVELIPYSNEELNIVGKEVLGSKGLPEAIVPIDGVKPSNSGGERFGYKINAANRVEEPVFRASYLVVGNSISKVKVETDKAGLEFREFSYMNAYSETLFEKMKETFSLAIAIAVFAVFMAVLYLGTAWGNKRVAREWDKGLLEDVANFLQLAETRDRLKNIKDVEISTIASEFVDVVRNSRLRCTPSWIQRLWLPGLVETDIVKKNTSNKAN